MLTLLIAVGSFVGYLIAYHTYGRWISRKIFQLDENAVVPSHELRDDVDFVPTKRQVIFGHHFTSIAGTGPIVGPAIAVFWGWLPALLWVFLGSIFIGAVHDLNALVISLRNRGQTVGEIAGRLISRRARLLFLTILFMALTVVLAIFGLVIAKIFTMYPQSVLPAWISLPLAMGIGMLVYRKGVGLMIPSLIALAIVYFCVWLGAYHFPVDISGWFEGRSATSVVNVTTAWTGVLLVYCFFASVLPVWLMLQPRDYINSHQLVIALGLLLLGVLVAGLSGKADLASAAPAISTNVPADAPPLMPFLFITIACGACSGFHCLVSSGTTSKQLEKETDAQYVAYGSMLLEGGLAVMVILACCAGLGMGIETAGGETLTGSAAWEARYNVGDGWSKFGLAQTVSAFVDGGANFLTAIGVDRPLGVGIIAVLVACFAATTLDSATRLQRYVIQELADSLRIKPLENKYTATLVAVVLAGIVALMPGGQNLPPGTGGLILWPLFGATNQLLAGLAFMVGVFYLWRRSRPIWFAAVPMVFMLIMPAWALLWQMFNSTSGWWSGPEAKQNMLLFSVGVAILALQVWMTIEGFLLLPRVRGILEEALPPLNRPSFAGADADRSGPNC